MKSKSTIIAMIIFSILFCNITEAKKTSKSKVKPKFEKFWTNFQKLVEIGDKEKIANFVSIGDDNPNWQGFVNDEPEKNPISNRNDFLKKYDLIFTTEMKLMIKNLKANDFIYGDEEGYDWYKSPAKKPYLDFCDDGNGYKLVNSSEWQ